MNSKSSDLTMKPLSPSFAQGVANILLTSKRLLVLVIFCIGPLYTWSQGSGQSVKFNGINQAINLGHDIDYPIRTIELWFKLDEDINSSLSDAVALVARDYKNGHGLSQNEFSLAFFPSAWNDPGHLVFLRRTGSLRYSIASDQNSWEKGRWYHVAGVVSSTGGMKLYINGVLQKSTHTSTEPIEIQAGDITDEICVGKWGHVNTRYFKGEVDELRFWDIPRTEEEIRAKMCSRISKPSNNLKLYLDFDVVTTKVNDVFNSSYSATMLNRSGASTPVSGAPIGNVSSYAYPNSWTAKTLQLSVGMDSVVVSKIPSTIKGAHIYQDVKPNTEDGLQNNRIPGNYFGVFLTDTTGTFDFTYHSRNPSICSGCVDVNTRNDNSSSKWIPKIPHVRNACAFQLQNQSTYFNSYRAEYLMSKGVEKSGKVTDLLFCEGDTISLLPSTNGDTYTWQDNSTSDKFRAWLAGTYWVAIDSAGCKSTDTFKLTAESVFSIDLGIDDLLVCEDSLLALNLHDSILKKGIEWTYGSRTGTSTPINLDTSGLFRLKVEHSCGPLLDSFEVRVEKGKRHDTVLCPDSSWLAKASISALSYQWNNADKERTRLLTDAGIHWVKSDLGECFITDSFELKFSDKLELELGRDTIICPNEKLSIGINFGDPEITYAWHDGYKEPLRTVSAPGTYWVEAITSCETLRDTVIVSYGDVIAPNLGPDTNICFPFRHALQVIGGDSIRWNTGVSDSLSISISDTGWYAVQLLSNGCRTHDSLHIGSDGCLGDLFLPNAFTPNATDAINPTFIGKGFYIEEYYMRVFNRWGECLFEGHDLTEGWDGTFRNIDCPAGVYVYVVSYRIMGRPPTYQAGNITLIR